MKGSPWGQVYDAPDLDTAYDNFESLVADSVEKHAPMIQQKVRVLHYPWRTTEIMNPIKTRDNHSRRARRSDSNHDGLCTGNTETRSMLASEKVKLPIVGK